MAAQTAQQARPNVPNPPADLTQFPQYLAKLQESFFLVGSVQAITYIPEGFSLQPNLVLIDVDGETYVQDGGRCLGKSAIERIASAAKAKVPHLVRIDDRRTRWFWEYEARATMPLLSGDIHEATASKYVDLTDEALGIRDGVANPAQRKQRENGQLNAETKARLRALRSILGIRSKYQEAELRRKPFLVLTLDPTGRTSNPALADEFARIRFAAAFGATGALYGQQAAARQLGTTWTPAALPAPAEQPRHALPGPSGDAGDDGPDDDGVDHATGEIREPEQPATQAAATQATKPAAEDVIPKGRGLPGEGKTFAQATPDELAAYIKAAEQILAIGKDAKGQPMPEPHMRAAAAKMQRAIDELDRRRAPQGQDATLGDAPW